MKNAIVYCGRQDLRNVFKDSLKKAGFDKVSSVVSAAEAIQALESESQLIVLDWDLGIAEVVQVLEKAKIHGSLDIRPVLLFASKISANFIATGFEYGVGYSLTGEVTPQVIINKVREIVKAEKAQQPLYNVLAKVSKARETDEWELATPILQGLAQKFPDNEYIALELAENLIHEGGWGEAKGVLEVFVNETSPHLRSLHIYARCLMHEKNYAEAEKILSRSKELNPFNAYRLVDLGDSLMGLARFEEARQSYQEAQSLDPDNVEAKQGEGKCLLVDGEVDAALELISDISGPRELAGIFNMSAVMAMKSKGFDQGFKLYERAMGVVGNNEKLLARLHFNQGIGYLRCNKKQEAKIQLEKALDLDPEFSKAKDRLTKVTESITGSIAIPVEDQEADFDYEGDGIEDDMDFDNISDFSSSALDDDDDFEDEFV